jgi:hypothetical protein
MAYGNMFSERKNMKKRVATVTVCLAIIILGACSPSQQAIQTAIAQTQAANPTSTSTLLPPTETPTFTPSSTLDLLSIQFRLKDFLLTQSDLSFDQEYHSLTLYSVKQLPNKDVHKDPDYATETGRMDGWVAVYKQGSTYLLAPMEIYNEISLFKTTEGAQLSIARYSNYITSELMYTEEINPPNIGDMTRSFYYTSDASGRHELGYLITFSYKNIVHLVQARGDYYGVEPEKIRNIARGLLSRLQAFPLFNP